MFSEWRQEPRLLAPLCASARGLPRGDDRNGPVIVCNLPPRKRSASFQRRFPGLIPLDRVPAFGHDPHTLCRPSSAQTTTIPFSFTIRRPCRLVCPCANPGLAVIVPTKYGIAGLRPIALVPPGSLRRIGFQGALRRGGPVGTAWRPLGRRQHAFAGGWP